MILLDTNALDSDRSAFVPLDEVQCRTLSSFAGIDNMVEHYRELLRLRSCMDGFGIKDMLRKDYKQWNAEGPLLPVSSQQQQQSRSEENDSERAKEASSNTLKYGLSSIISSYASCQETSENGTAHLDAMRSFAADLGLGVRKALRCVVCVDGQTDGRIFRCVAGTLPTSTTRTQSHLSLCMRACDGVLPRFWGSCFW